ncbi:tRNA 2-thiouridine(34) synthase MnmA [Anaplasma capra]|uniref:tRNA 2-thiouridine(34) synthase MnmA n=1 Tax=Anaplasma capra TaxID=1562740 RepID=UPI0021D5709A|nr:tRNA 2-thiouridine(34) synthase MnmA [Anaplasma capra]MCU7611384.1 tRNA 2-thiouridine(34) synthase MnmA [Anaplasma capra]MCU7612459.1 tRNA 2-thiouridine(34) synthase MnmA [Anaplasma capra]
MMALDSSFDLDPLVPGKLPKETTVVVAMSGGVDSSVVAALLHKRGYKVIGATMQLYGSTEPGGKSCCGSADIYDAKRVAHMLGFPHYVLDYKAVFEKEVIEDFVNSYKHGETPIPCVKCNQTVKFRDMLKAARTVGGDVVATGHYVRRVEVAGEQQILVGRDTQKDQSYFLFPITPEQLEFLRFPLGNLVKSDVRRLAQHFNLEVADKPDSQDICFVPKGNYREMLKNLDPALAKRGKIVHVDGRLLGEHDGISNFTVGQRRGLNISAPYPLYVVRLDAAQNTVVVGPQSALRQRKLFVKNLNWLPKCGVPEHGLAVGARLRSSGATVRATVTNNGNNYGTVVLEEDCVVSPGQACVFYDEERLLGGGWIYNKLHCESI